MKTVLILRHAKSSWSDPNLLDFDRPLAKRGLSDAPRIGHLLADFEVVPQVILSSPAKRATQTAQIVAEACGYKNKISWHRSFYGGSSDTLVEALQQLPNNVERAMLVGHNPTLEETVATMLLGYGERWTLDFGIKLPTAGLVCLDFDLLDWTELEPGDATLRWFVIPKLLKAIE